MLLVDSLFHELYQTGKSDYIDPKYNPPKDVTIEQWRDWVKVGEFKGDGDGQDCEVYESRLPARFYKLVVKPTPNSVGDINQGYKVTTGSGSDMGRMLFTLARQISEGMIGFYPEA